MSGHDGRVERAVTYDPELRLMACRQPDGTVVLLDWADLLAADDPGRDEAAQHST